MANGGWYGTMEEWEQIEKPLLEIDSIIGDFTNEFGLSVSKNHKDWPERSIEWGKEVRCLIQLYLSDEKLLTYNLWLCASQDRGDKRYWKKETSVNAKQLSEFKDDLASLLREGREKLVSWSENNDQLEFATTLG